jgi:hypothetical protein
MATTKLLAPYVFVSLFSICITGALGRVYLDYYMSNLKPVESKQSEIIYIDVSESKRILLEKGFSKPQVAEKLIAKVKTLADKGYIVSSKENMLAIPPERLVTVVE